MDDGMASTTRAGTGKQANNAASTHHVHYGPEGHPTSTVKEGGEG